MKLLRIGTLYLATRKSLHVPYKSSAYDIYTGKLKTRRTVCHVCNL